MMPKISEARFVTIMQLADLKWLFEEYPLDVFVRTPDIISIKQLELPRDIEEKLRSSVESYFKSVVDLIANRNVYSQNNIQSVRQWLSKQIDAIIALRNIVQLFEDMTSIFNSEVNWARALAIRGIIDVLDSIGQQLTILKNQVKKARFINRIREKTYYVISQKISQVFNILTTMIAIELGQTSSSEIVSAIGKGIITSTT